MLDAQFAFQQKLSSYMDGSGLSNSTRIAFPIFGRRACLDHAQPVINAFRQFQDELAGSSAKTSSASLEVMPYDASHPYVQRLGDAANGCLKESLCGAYVHGSLGTGEEVAYSDFDALLILRDDIFQSKEHLAQTCHTVLRTQKLLSDYDPLQHHGFFVISESDLRHYPDSVFPQVLFEHAKSLMRAGDKVELQVPDAHCDQLRPLLGMLDAIERKAKHPGSMTNLFEVKLFLSQLMLVPCLFLQAKGTPVFKRESFAIVRGLDESTWRAVEFASALRKDWPSIDNRFWSRFFRVIPHPFLTTIYQKKIGAVVPPAIRSRLTDEFFQMTLSLVNAIRCEFATNGDELGSSP